jgi:GNAT superfamily N-acetyltransferase
MPVTVRHLEPSDYAPVIAVVDDWWGGRRMRDMLPKLFFVHFRPTSFAAEADGALAGFLCGFVSQTDPDVAYVHFIGVDPARRGERIGRALYERLFAAARAAGCRQVRAVTSPRNQASIAFHRRIGFEVLPGSAVDGGAAYTPGYDGPGEDRVVFALDLAAPNPDDAHDRAC